MRIASMDNLITLYFSLGIVDSKFFDMGSMECLANKLVDISVKSRNNPSSFPLPFISIKCVGHQPSLPSLIREKIKRITQKKQQPKELPKELRNTVNTINTVNTVNTIKNKRNKRNTIKLR